MRLGFLDAKGIAQASLVGHSWGGDWALHFAQQHPERVHKLVLIGSSGMPGGDRLEWELLKVPVLGELMTNLFGRRAVRWGLEAAFADPSIVTPEMVEEIYAAVSSPENRWAQVAYSRNLDLEEVQRAVPATRIPTLIIYGDADQYGPYEEGRALAEALPDARFELVGGAGHNAHEEKPEEIDALITGFLSSD